MTNSKIIVALSLLFIATFAYAKKKQVFPDKASVPFHYLYKGVYPSKTPSMVSVLSPGYDNEGNVTSQNGNRTTISTARLELERKWAKSVFMATTHDGSGRGTAFLVAPSIVMTNKHLFLDKGIPMARKDWDCGKFKITAQISSTETQDFDCNFVYFCGKGVDFCVVSIQKSSRGKSIDQYAKPIPLSRDHGSSGEELTLIGNTMDYGLSASASTEHEDSYPALSHYIASDHGASGSPVLNSKGEAIAIHYLGASEASPHNSALLMDVIAKELAYFSPEVYEKLFPKPASTEPPPRGYPLPKKDDEAFPENE